MAKSKKSTNGIWRYTIAGAKKLGVKSDSTPTEFHIKTYKDKKIKGQRYLFEDTATEITEYAKGGKTKNDISDKRIKDITKHYAIAALWSSNDSENDDQPFDSDYSVSDIDEKSMDDMENTVRKFVEQNDAVIKESGITDEQLGHDLWLTRNGHGTGFWDRDLPGDTGENLSEAARKLGESNLYAENGKVKIDGFDKDKSFAKGGKTKNKTYKVSVKFKTTSGHDATYKTELNADSEDEAKAIAEGKTRREHNFKELISVKIHDDKFGIFEEGGATKPIGSTGVFANGGNVYTEDEFDVAIKRVIDNGDQFEFSEMHTKGDKIGSVKTAYKLVPVKNKSSRKWKVFKGKDQDGIEFGLMGQAWEKEPVKTFETDADMAAFVRAHVLSDNSFAKGGKVLTEEYKGFVLRTDKLDDKKFETAVSKNGKHLNGFIRETAAASILGAKDKIDAGVFDKEQEDIGFAKGGKVGKTKLTKEEKVTMILAIGLLSNYKKRFKDTHPQHIETNQLINRLSNKNPLMWNAGDLNEAIDKINKNKNLYHNEKGQLDTIKKVLPELKAMDKKYRKIREEVAASVTSRQIDWDVFEEEFNPVQNTVSNREEYNGWLFETYGADEQHVFDYAKKHPHNVWTILDTDEGYQIITNGLHHVNRFGYVITKNAWKENEMIEVVDQDDIERAENEDDDFKKGGETSGGDKHKYYIKVYNTEEDYKNKIANTTDKNKMSWEKAIEVRQKFEEANPYAVQILSVKGGRVVSNSLSFAKGGKTNLFEKYSNEQLGEAYKEVVGYNLYEDLKENPETEDVRKDLISVISDYDDNFFKEEKRRPFAEYFSNKKFAKGGKTNKSIKTPTTFYNAAVKYLKEAYYLEPNDMDFDMDKATEAFNEGENPFDYVDSYAEKNDLDKNMDYGYEKTQGAKELYENGMFAEGGKIKLSTDQVIEKFKGKIASKQMVRSFFKNLSDDLDTGFHPDDDFAEYTEVNSEKKSFPKEQADDLNKIMEECFDWCAKNNEDIYGIGLSVQQKELKKRGIFAEGGQMGEFKIGDRVKIINSNGVYDGHSGKVLHIDNASRELDVATDYIPEGILVRFDDVRKFSFFIKDLPDEVYDAIYALNSRIDVDDEIGVIKESDGSFYIESKDGVGSLIIEKNTDDEKEKLVWEWLDKNRADGESFAEGGKTKEEELFNGRYLKIVKKGNKLCIYLTEDGKEEAKENPIDYKSFYEYFEDVQGNSELKYWDDASESGFGLTESPVITDGYYFGDDGEIKSHKDAHMWWFPNYQIASPFEHLTEEGEVEFIEAEDSFETGGVPFGSNAPGNSEFGGGDKPFGSNAPGSFAQGGKVYSDEEYTKLKNKKMFESSGVWIVEAKSGFMKKHKTEDEALTYFKKEYPQHGVIENQYAGKEVEQVWNAWTKEQRIHFIEDHFNSDSFANSDKTKHHYFNSLMGLVDLNFENIPDVPLKSTLDSAIYNHIHHGQYAKGGDLPGLNYVDNLTGIGDEEFAKGGAIGRQHYVAMSSWFDTHDYDVEKIKSIVSSAGGKNVHTENQYGWHNQPEVVVFNVSDDSKKVVQEALQKGLDTEWIIINEKDWRVKKMKEGGELNYADAASMPFKEGGKADNKTKVKLTGGNVKNTSEVVEGYLYDNGDIDIPGYGLYKKGNFEVVSNDTPLTNYNQDYMKRIANSDANSYTENRIPFKGNNLEGKTLDSGDYVVLSFGYYPIWFYSAVDKKWYGNSDDYCRVTAMQRPQTRPSWDATMLPVVELFEKMKCPEAKFEIGGVTAVIQTLSQGTDTNLAVVHQ